MALLALLACDGDGAAGAPDAAAGGGEAPVITAVRWERAGACGPGAPSDYTITTTVSDPDTDAAQVTLSGAILNCLPDVFTSRVQTVRCPNLAPYPGAVTVRDPQGHTAAVTFTLDICTDGMVAP